MRRTCATLCVALALCIAAVPSHAQLKDENLLIGLPQGFKVGFTDSRNGMNMQEWVPANETVQNWTEMVTVQIFLNRKDIEPAQFLANMEKQWAAACKGSTAAPAVTGKVNGYTSATRLFRCPLLASTGKPETTMMKAIKGNDSFYLVQRAVRAAATPEQLEHTKQYLERVSLCDSRSAASPCPVLK